MVREFIQVDIEILECSSRIVFNTQCKVTEEKVSGI